MQTDGQMDAQTDMMKLTATFHNLVNVPKTFTTADKQYIFFFVLDHTDP